MQRRAFLDRCAATAALAFTSPELLLAQPARQVFSPKYDSLRRRFLHDFEHKGFIAASANGKGRHFGDQTFHMGFALVTFAGEAQLLRRLGHDTKPSEAVVRRILNAIELLDKNAEMERYHTAVRGFFLRDYVKADHWPGQEVTSDFIDCTSKNDGTADMSIDQLVGLMMGWWAVAHWSTDEGNRKLARGQVERALGYLRDERFWIDRPGTHAEVSAGADARAAAGFLCHMAEQITGQDYYHGAKVRLKHDNKCHICGGTGEVNAEANLQCPGCNGTGECKIVLGGGRCEACRGTGDVKVVVEQDCPTCGGSGELHVVVSDPWPGGKDHTIGKGRCPLCNGSGKIGGKTELGKCKVCNGKGRLPQYTKDLGKCKLCGGSGRLKGKAPKINCPICGGTKELNLYVAATHPIILGLIPAGLGVGLLSKPSISLSKTGKITIEGTKLGESFARHMALVCFAFEDAVPDAVVLAGAKESNHPWSVLLRAARLGTVCAACHGQGKQFVMVADRVLLIDVHHHHPGPTFKRHDLGPCAVCHGTGTVSALPGSEKALLSTVLPEVLALHRSCPEDGPSVQAKPIDWCKSNRWERCTDLKRDQGTDHYNGSDFLSMEVLLRLAGESVPG